MIGIWFRNNWAGEAVGLLWKNLIKRIVVDLNLGLVGLHIKGMFWDKLRLYSGLKEVITFLVCRKYQNTENKENTVNIMYMFILYW